jgi:DNA repair exonuclease SbcCD nuclease subunit
LVQLALDENVLFVLLAGDIYDGAERGVRAQIRFLSGLRRLDEAGIRTFIVHGNHDPLSGWSAIREWPAHVTIFGSRAVESVPVELEGEQVAVIHGISYSKRETTDNLACRFTRGDGGGLHIGLLHANVGAVSEHAAYAPCSLADLAAAGMDYWALGHIHKRQVLRAGDPWMVYPGDTQGRSPKPSESQEKGAFVVSVSGGTINPPEFHALDGVRYVESEHDISGIADIAQLHSHLGKSLDALRTDNEGRALLVRVALLGRGPLAGDLARPGALDGLLTELRESCGALEPFLWVESIRDRTRQDLDFEAIRARGDFSAGVLAFADRLGADSEATGEFVGARSALLTVGQVQRALRGFEPDDPLEVLAEAVELAIDGVESGAS